MTLAGMPNVCIKMRPGSRKGPSRKGLAEKALSRTAPATATAAAAVDRFARRSAAFSM